MTTLAELAARARGLLVPGSRAVLGIAGAPGAGKSTLASALLDELRRCSRAGSADLEWVTLVPMDGFHLADVELDRLGLRHRKGAPQTFDVAGYVNTLHRLRSDLVHTIYSPSFDRTLEQPLAGAVPVIPSVRLVLTEGNYLLHTAGLWAQVQPQLDEVWYVETDEVQRRARLVARHIEYGKTPERARAWVAGVDEPNAGLVAQTRSSADLVVTLPGNSPPPSPPTGPPSPGIAEE